MKSLFFTLGLMIATSSYGMSFDCNQQEAQFIGTVREVQMRSLDQKTTQCFYKIQYSQYNPSMLCPLDIDEAYNAEFQDTSCQLRMNDEVSGYMVKKGDSLYIE